MVHLERIKELCEKKNVTMKQAAIELGMTEQSLHKIIKANSTKIDTLLSMAQYFNVEPACFFDNYSAGASDGVCISKEELEGLIKKVIAYSIHGFGMVKLEWDAKEQKFNSYFDVLKKQYSPDASDLKYISSLLETDVHITDKTTPKDVARVPKMNLISLLPIITASEKWKYRKNFKSSQPFWISIIFLSLIPLRKILMNLKAGLSIMKVRVL